jgi:hypothetical protein
MLIDSRKHPPRLQWEPDMTKITIERETLERAITLIHQAHTEDLDEADAVSAALRAAQPAEPVALTGEQDRALCEAHCNDATDEYFNARPQLDSTANRRIFYAGHRQGWIAHGIAASPEVPNVF